jgi:hypothetical protein
MNKFKKLAAAMEELERPAASCNKERTQRNGSSTYINEN